MCRKRKHDIEEGGVCSLRDLREHCRKQGLVCIPAMDAVILSSHQRFKETYNRPGHDDIQSLTNRQSVAVLLRGFISYVGFISNSICFALQELGLHPEIQVPTAFHEGHSARRNCLRLFHCVLFFHVRTRPEGKLSRPAIKKKILLMEGAEIVWTIVHTSWLLLRRPSGYILRLVPSGART
eukprot:GHVQ01013634.1.p1 GENE.GHVQ01013634.1~~GHVQ01013634.1.p1  ORF type:complete len:181 (+),score=6.61 GHVQ01013634.1:14-556(+)